MKSQKGITLITVVITIIVLLILAGVSISLVVGDNGILLQATEAVIESRKSTAIEDISMAWAELEAEYIRKQTTNTNISKDNYFNEKNFEAKLEDKGFITDESFIYDIDSQKTTFFKYISNTDPGKEYAVSIYKDGKIILDCWASTITAANYGDYVDYPVDINGDGETAEDWKIFYSNGNNVFLIASDYVDKNLIKAGITPYEYGGDAYPYSLYWTRNAPTTISETLRKDKLFGINSNSYELNPLKENSRCVSTILDTANWIGFKDEKGYGEYAIGGPTIEMWINSWNAKGVEFGTDKYERLKVQTDENGYYVGPESINDLTDTFNYSLNTNSIDGRNDELYFPHKTPEKNCYSYWLASPSAEAETHVLRVRCYGLVYSLSHFSNGVGARPIVALSSDVIGTKDENGIWTLSK